MKYLGKNNELHGKDQDTRERILQAAVKLFAEKGFHGVSVKEISVAAGTNTALLFYYFNSKKDLYDAIYQDARNILLEVFEEISEGKASARECLEELIRHFLEDFSRDCDFDLLISREIHGFGEYTREELAEMLSSVLAPLEKIVSRGIREGIFRKINPRLAALSIMALLHPMSKHNFLTESEFTQEEIFGHVRDMVMACLLRSPE